MIIIKKYVFDLDNTLIYTDFLNNEAYNYALKCIGLQPMDNYKRVTREIVFKKYPNIRKIQENKILELKKEYFINNMQLAKLNGLLIEMLKSLNRNDCILWTSADETRTRAILKYYNMTSLFKCMVFSSKKNVMNDIEEICKLHECNLNQLVIYEDNLRLIDELKKLKLNVVEV
ncbi:HAD family hydrolase [uncultured Clostridium sp.]|jgi:hypothetical protein|uniref:HAD family hydrolase n=1 Tax=uncultured Clostridium sp. TaxID=59620 RepID=UPI0025F905C8|nr:HAD hydrolase-like protein [uncultured Clostridium sp.]